MVEASMSGFFNWSRGHFAAILKDRRVPIVTQISRVDESWEPTCQK